MRDFTKRFVLALVAVVSFAVNANAGSTFYAYYDKLVSYPTGAGTVYATTEYSTTPTDDQYASEQEWKQVSTAGSYYAFAKPTAGWLFASISAATPEVDANGEPTGNFVYSDSIVATGNPAYVELSSNITDDAQGEKSDSSTVAGMMPLDPITQHYAIFTHVIPELYPGQGATMGAVKIDKVSNNIGDQVTMTATPAKGATFEKWMLSKNGEFSDVSTDATLTITVSDTAHYVAKFTAPFAEDVDFGNGECRFYYPGDSTDITIPKTFRTISFQANNLTKDSLKKFTATYQMPAGNACILYGKGKGTLVSVHNDYPYADRNSLNRWSGDAGVKVDTLDKSHAYYTFDLKTAVLSHTTGTIDAKQTYVAVPDTALTKVGYTVETAPATLLTGATDVTAGIEGIHVVKQVAPGIYTIDGRRLDAMRQNGLYIVDGKKVLFRKK